MRATCSQRKVLDSLFEQAAKAPNENWKMRLLGLQRHVRCISIKLQRRCKSDSRSRGQAPAFTIGEECEHADAWWRKTWLSLFATIHLSECKACFSKKLINCKRRERSCSALQGLSLRTYGQCRTFVGTPYQDGSSSSCTSERP